MEDKLIAFIQSLDQGELEFIRAKSMEMLGESADVSAPAPTVPASGAITAANFSVPPDIKYLDSEQLEALTAAFGTWYRKATRADIHRARVSSGG